jgi:hypothetical protein
MCSEIPHAGWSLMKFQWQQELEAISESEYYWLFGLAMSYWVRPNIMTKSLLVASRNATETQDTDVCIMIWVNSPTPIIGSWQSQCGVIAVCQCYSWGRRWSDALWLTLVWLWLILILVMFMFEVGVLELLCNLLNMDNVLLTNVEQKCAWQLWGSYL